MTKLRHVDIYNYWLRERIERGEVRVNYVPTKEQVADGLTKALAEPDFKRFRKLIRVVDISRLLQQRQATLRKISDEDVQALKDLIEGGEAKLPILEV